MNPRPLITILSGALLIAATARETIASPADDTSGHDFDPTILVTIAVMLVAAKLGGELFARLHQPAVLGELFAGIVLGNLVIFGFTGVEPLKTNTIVAVLAELGVILLLFEVGLESNLKEMMAVGWSSLLVALLGVVTPFLLGWGVAAYFLPNEARLVHIFIGATLCATSVGITARVFKDLRKLATREARIILGAAVIDDVLGLIILAIVSGAIRASATGAALSLMQVTLIAAKAFGFLLAAIIAGHFIIPKVLRAVGRLESRGILLTFAISFCLFLAWAADKFGLAPIVGAFAAGLVLDEVHYRPGRESSELASESAITKTGERSLAELLQPVSAVLVPIFFVLMGMKVDLRLFAQVELLGFAFALTLVAIIGKQICSLGVLERGVNRTAIGLGMIPRGEVGLIFAGIGASLLLPTIGGPGEAIISTPVIGPATFGAIVIMVIVTTLITPPALKWSLGKTLSFS